MQNGKLVTTEQMGRIVAYTMISEGFIRQGRREDSLHYIEKLANELEAVGFDPDEILNVELPEGHDKTPH